MFISSRFHFSYSIFRYTVTNCRTYLYLFLLLFFARFYCSAAPIGLIQGGSHNILKTFKRNVQVPVCIGQKFNLQKIYPQEQEISLQAAQYSQIPSADFQWFTYLWRSSQLKTHIFDSKFVKINGHKSYNPNKAEYRRISD